MRIRWKHIGGIILIRGFFKITIYLFLSTFSNRILDGLCYTPTDFLDTGKTYLRAAKKILPCSGVLKWSRVRQAAPSDSCDGPIGIKSLNPRPIGIKDSENEPQESKKSRKVGDCKPNSITSQLCHHQYPLVCEPQVMIGKGGFPQEELFKF